MKIKMLCNVRPDLIFLAKPGTILRAGMQYEAVSNKNGAISGICENGEALGVKPGGIGICRGPAMGAEYLESNGGAIDGVDKR